MDNTINTYQEEIKTLYETIKQLNNKVDDLELKYKKDIEDKNNTINNLQNELNECIENCNDKINCLENEINNKEKLIEEYKRRK